MSNSLQLLMGSGIAAGAAQSIGGNIANGLTSTGTTQGGALLLCANYNVVSTAPLNGGVILPATAQPSDEFEVFNIGANPVAVYPPVGAAINNGAANASIAVAVGKSARLVCITPTLFGAIVSA